jgi:hypothetical protein
MNLDALKKRKLELEQTMANLTQNWATVQGSKAEVELWIQELEKEAATAVPEVAAPVAE